MAITAKTNPRQLEPNEYPYIAGQPFIHPTRRRPHMEDAQRWRLIASEPINKLARRMIQREIATLNFSIRPEDPKDQRQQDAAEWYTLVYKDFRGITTRALKSLCELPHGGAWEVGWVRPSMFGEGPRGTLAFVRHIDAGTLRPTANPAFPIVQIDPFNTHRHVLFTPNEIVRIVGWPHDEYAMEWWQESPTEASFLAIEALSRIYTYSLKQLRDTPVAGILDLMDFSEEDAVEWAKAFREMLQGIDPIKIPIVYQHEEPAKWLPMGNNFSELEIPTQFKFYTDLVLSNYGLSVNDLRILDHSGTKTGMAVSSKTTMRQGISFFAELMKDVVQSTLPAWLIFEYDNPDLEDERTRAQIRAADSRTLETMASWLPVRIRAEQAKKWGIIDVEIDPDELEEEAKEAQEAAPMAGPKPGPGQLEAGEGRVPDELEDDAKDTASTGSRVFTKALAHANALVEKAADRFLSGQSQSKAGRKMRVAEASFESLLAAAFREVGGGIGRPDIAALLNNVYTQFPDLVQQINEEPMQAKSWTVFVETLAVNPHFLLEKQEDVRNRIEIMLEELLSADDDLYVLPADFEDEVMRILKLAYEEGLLEAAEMVQAELYGRGIAKSPYVTLSFNVTNPDTINFLRTKAAEAVKHINDGTRHYLRRMITEGALEGLSVDVLTDRIHADLFGLPEAEAGKLNRARIRSIVTTELNRADTFGRLKQMNEVGLKLKRWITRLTDVCNLCLGNEAYESVPIDFMYDDVFGKTLGPPGHPATCHCQLGGDAEELSKLGVEPKYWTGAEKEKQKAVVSDNGHFAIPLTAKDMIDSEFVVIEGQVTSVD